MLPRWQSAREAVDGIECHQDVANPPVTFELLSFVSLGLGMASKSEYVWPREFMSR